MHQTYVILAHKFKGIQYRSKLDNHSSLHRLERLLEFLLQCYIGSKINITSEIREARLKESRAGIAFVMYATWKSACARQSYCIYVF